MFILCALGSGLVVVHVTWSMLRFLVCHSAECHWINKKRWIIFLSSQAIEWWVFWFFFSFGFLSVFKNWLVDVMNYALIPYIVSIIIYSFECLFHYVFSLSPSLNNSSIIWTRRKYTNESSSLEITHSSEYFVCHIVYYSDVCVFCSYLLFVYLFFSWKLDLEYK